MAALAIRRSLWAETFQSLTVLDYLLHAGSENVVLYFKDNLYIIKTLKEFQYVDEDGKDCGANVRQKAKDISNLLSDTGRLREERRNRASMRDRMIRGHPSMDGEEEGGGIASQAPAPERRSRPPERDDDELRRAIEASKQSLAEEQARQTEETDLQRAIRLSEEEEAKRNKAVEDSNASSLFDDHAQLYVFSSEDRPRIEFSVYHLDRHLRMVRTILSRLPILHHTQPVFNLSLPFNPNIQCNHNSRPSILTNNRHNRKRCRYISCYMVNCLGRCAHSTTGRISETAARVVAPAAGITSSATGTGTTATATSTSTTATATAGRMAPSTTATARRMASSTTGSASTAAGPATVCSAYRIRVRSPLSCPLHSPLTWPPAAPTIHLHPPFHHRPCHTRRLPQSMGLA